MNVKEKYTFPLFSWDDENFYFLFTSNPNVYDEVVEVCGLKIESNSVDEIGGEKKFHKNIKTKKMIKLFSLKQQKKEGETGGQKSQRSAAQLRITKGEWKTRRLT